MRNILFSLKNEKGVTSVLIIFMMIVLVTLGAFSITSARVNYKFAERSKQWDTDFYELDNKAEDYLMEVDLKLAEAENLSVEYINSQGYSQDSYGNIPDDLQVAIALERQLTTGGKVSTTKFIEDTMNKVYLYYANNLLNELSIIYPDNTVYVFSEGNLIENLESSISIRDEENEEVSINVSLRVNPVAFDINLNNGVNGNRKEGYKRYDIIAWNELQKESEPEEVIDIPENNENLFDDGTKDIFDN